MPLLELNVEGVWLAKQPGNAKGTPATTAQKRFRKVAGDLAVNRSDGSENYSDGQRLSSEVTFVDTMAGGGSPGFQAQASIVGYLAWLWAGQETTSGVATNAVQTGTVTGTPAGGTTILDYDGQKTSALAFNSTAAQVQAALERLSKIGKGNVVCAGGPWPGTPITMTFQAQMAASPVVLITNADSFTGGTTPALAITMSTTGAAVEHVVTPGSSSFWVTAWKLLGASTPIHERYNDCRIGGLQIVSGNQQKVVRVTPTLISLDPGERVAADPAQAEDIDFPLLYTEGEGQFKINGTVIRNITGFSVNMTDALTPVYGDSPKPNDVASGQGQVEIGDVQLNVDSEGLKQVNSIIYGSESPPAGAKPVTTIPTPGSFEFNIWRTNTALNPGRQIKLVADNVQWSPDGLAIAGNPDGGVATVTLASRTRKVGASPHFTLTTRSADAAYV